MLGVMIMNRTLLVIVPTNDNTLQIRNQLIRRPDHII